MNEPATGKRKMAKPKQQAAPKEQKEPMVPPAPTPWPDPVDGGELASEIARTFGRHMVLPVHVRDVSAVWSVATHKQRAAVHFPRLFPFSPSGGCGKTTFLELLEFAVYRGVLMDKANPSLIMRVVDMVGQGECTLLLDEADNYINDKFVNILNSGWARDKKFWQNTPHGGEDWEPKAYEVYSAMIFCRLSNLDNEAKFKTVVTRTIEWYMGKTTKAERKGHGVVRFDKNNPAHNYSHLARKAARWAGDNEEAIKRALSIGDEAIGLPESDNERLTDSWRMLFAVAHCMGAEWTARMQSAYSVCSEQSLSSSDIDTELAKAVTRALATIPHWRAKGEKWVSSVDLGKAFAVDEAFPYAERFRCDNDKSLGKALSGALKKFKEVVHDKFNSSTSGYTVASLELFAERWCGSVLHTEHTEHTEFPNEIKDIRGEAKRNNSVCDTELDGAVTALTKSLPPSHRPHVPQVGAADVSRLQREGAVMAMRPIIELVIPEWRDLDDTELASEIARCGLSTDPSEIGRMTADFVEQMRDAADAAAKEAAANEARRKLNGSH